MEEKYPKGHQRGTHPTGFPFGNPSAMARRGPAGPLAGHPPGERLQYWFCVNVQQYTDYFQQCVLFCKKTPALSDGSKYKFTELPP